MDVDEKLLAPCGLYCGVCAVLIAHRDDNMKFKERLTGVYGLTDPEQISCKGCLSEERFILCESCLIRDCVKEKGIEGCHECDDFPCEYIDQFPIEVGKRVIMRAVPYRREVGTEKWVEDEEKRYLCPHCGYVLFRGAKRCRNCKAEVDLD
jgi:predicted RNA-binding Zn-ribbon protein involved in translation (DUF1610 family)